MTIILKIEITIYFLEIINEYDTLVKKAKSHINYFDVKDLKCNIQN